MNLGENMVAAISGGFLFGGHVCPNGHFRKTVMESKPDQVPNGLLFDEQLQ